MTTRLLLAVALALAAGCSTTQGDPADIGTDSGVAASPVPGGSASSPVVPAGEPGAPADTAGDQARIARLEREARALARTTGCTGAEACRTAPVGVRPCGGPRGYVVYCSATTDSTALYGKLRELERVERAYNERSGMMSTCEFRSPPGAALVGGSCREGAAPGSATRVP
jgi:hypothetical protein